MAVMCILTCLRETFPLLEIMGLFAHLRNFPEVSFLLAF